MAIELISKIKPKNGGSFPMVDAEDVAMPDGTRLSEAELGGSVELDATLTQRGKAADAGAVGAVLEEAMVILGSLDVLPEVTAADHGKILQVVNGAWTAVTVTDSEIAAYVDDYINSALEGDY